MRRKVDSYNIGLSFSVNLHIYISLYKSLFFIVNLSYPPFSDCYSLYGVFSLLVSLTIIVYVHW
jgi:hypothetical protein